MSDGDQMRDEFESWAKRNGCDTVQAKGEDGYWLFHTHLAWLAWQAAYAAGRRAEREAIQRKNEEWSKAVNKAWIETANEREGQL